MYLSQATTISHTCAPPCKVSSIKTPTEHHSMDEVPYVENERAAAFAWLMENPTGRAITAPSELDAVLNMYAAQQAYPGELFGRSQFITDRSTHPSETETRHVGYRGYRLV